MTSELAAARLQECGRRVRLADAEQLEAWIFLGRELIEIQDSEAYRGEPINCSTWKEFLDDEERGFPKLTGLHSRTAYDYIDLARSKTLASMTPAERAAVARCGTAGALARLDKAGAMTPVIRQQAQTLQRQQFREATGASKGVVVTKWLADVAAGRHLQRLVNILAGASADALCGLADLMEKPETAAYAGGPTNRVDFLLGLVATMGEEEFALLHVHESELAELGDDPEKWKLRALVFREQGYRCAHCSKRGTLHLHRIIFGSHGGEYVRENVKALCYPGCHEAAHGRGAQAAEAPVVIQ